MGLYWYYGIPNEADLPLGSCACASLGLYTCVIIYIYILLLVNCIEMFKITTF
jgi:hypothetical protein